MFAKREAEQFLAGLEQSHEVQERVLAARIVGPNIDTELGRKAGFAKLRTLDEYRRALPITDYEGFRPAVERMLAGEQGLLTAEPPKRYFLTSGSSAQPKHIPVTQSFIRDKSRAFGIYWSLVFAQHPEVATGRMVTNFSDAGGAASTHPGGALVSSESAFWAEVTAATQRKTPLIPKVVARIADTERRYYAVARILLEERFAAMMALNPSTLLLLFQKLEAHAERLIADVERGGIDAAMDPGEEARAYLASTYPGDPSRAAELRALWAARGGEVRLPASLVFPSLRLAISWRSPMLAPYLELLGPHLGTVAGRDYLTMASEGVMAVPLTDGESGGALAVGVHLYELLPYDDDAGAAKETVLPHQAEVGREYVVVLSNGAGLYRYDIGDVVRVRGFRGNTPIVEFLHRKGATSSLTGEKLTEAQVTAAFQRAAAAAQVRAASFTLAPAAGGHPRYVLLVEPAATADPARLGGLLAAFDRELGIENLEYASKRRSERLGPPDLARVAEGSYAARKARRVEEGAAELQVKEVHLSRDAAFAGQLEVLEIVRGA